MPRLHDRERIRSILETERTWTVYALADLEPGLFENAQWFCTANHDEPGLGLFFSGFAMPVLITIGTASALESVIEEIIEDLDPRAIYAAVKPEVMALLTERYRVVEEKKMQRMVFDPKQYRPRAKSSAVPLRLTDLKAIQHLYADGEGNGEAPDWFLPQMLEQETYYGIREGEDLVAVAGTHVVSWNEKLACLGNIYTRRDRRGRGSRSQVTSAVVAKLAQMELTTIVLNVRINNATAIHIYEGIGFRKYCDYIEAPLVKGE
jgi:RimJ/RimL family protein N-acetyltransferase